jgi:hypothetical protein
MKYSIADVFQLLCLWEVLLGLLMDIISSILKRFYGRFFTNSSILKNIIGLISSITLWFFPVFNFVRCVSGSAKAPEVSSSFAISSHTPTVGLCLIIRPNEFSVASSLKISVQGCAFH